MAVKEMNASEFKDMLNDEQGIDIIDVRTEYEFKENHVENSRNIPINAIQARIQEIDWNKRVVFICRSGARSRMVAQHFSDEGKNIYNLSNGIFDL